MRGIQKSYNFKWKAIVEQEVPIDSPQQEAPIDSPSQEVPVETPLQEVPIDTEIEHQLTENQTEETPIDSPPNEVPIETEIEDQSIENQREETPIDNPQQEVAIDTEIEDQSTENPREEETENVDVRDWDEDSDGENGRGRGTSTIKRSRNRGRVHGGRVRGIADRGKVHVGRGRKNSRRIESVTIEMHEEDDVDIDFAYISESELLAEVGWGSEEDIDDDDDIRFPEFNIDKDLANPVLEVSQVFCTFEEFKQACKALAVRQRRAVWFPINDKTRVICQCKKKCGFRVYAKLKQGDVQIATANIEHTCGVDEDIRALSRDFLAKTYLDRFLIDPGWSIWNLQRTILADFSLK